MHACRSRDLTVFDGISQDRHGPALRDVSGYKLLLNGDAKSRPSGVPPLHSDAFVERFARAFGSQCARDCLCVDC